MDDTNATAVNPGGVPIFYKNVVIGGVGVVTSASASNVAEFAAFTGSTTARTGPTDSFGPTPAAPGVVFIGGVALPFVIQTSLPAGFSAGPVAGTGGFLFSPTNSQGQPPEGDLIAPAAGPLGGLNAPDVMQILDNAEATANTTRAAIRLPIGSRTKMVIAVADTDGTIIGLRRMPDSTVFSIDVAVTKARNMVYFNSASRTAADLQGVPLGTAVTNRTIGFGAQPLYPPELTVRMPGRSSIFIRWTSPVLARKDYKPERQIRTRAELFSFRAARACIATARSSAGSVLAATEWMRTITLRMAEQLDSRRPQLPAPTRLPIRACVCRTSNFPEIPRTEPFSGLRLPIVRIRSAAIFFNQRPRDFLLPRAMFASARVNFSTVSGAASLYTNCPWRRQRISPASLRIFRWCETVARVTPLRVTISPQFMCPRCEIDSKMQRRVSSASALEIFSICERFIRAISRDRPESS